MKSRIPLLGDVVERGLNDVFYRFGEFVGVHPLPFLLIPILMTSILSLGMIKATVETDLRTLYTSTNAPSQAEFQAWSDFVKSPNTAKYIDVEIFFYVKETDHDKNMLSQNRSDIVVNFDKYVTKELNYTYQGRTYNFGSRVIANSTWSKFMNKPLFTFLNIYHSKKLMTNPNVHFEYPVMEAFGIKFFLGFNVMGVPVEHNRSEAIREAQLLKLQYATDLVQSDITEDEWEAFRIEVTNYAKTIRGQKNLEIIVMNFGEIESESQRSTLACAPFIPLSCLLVLAFTILSTMSTDSLSSKSQEAILGCLACAMAVASTFGLMFACGLSYNPFVAVTPFLAFAIGIDDTFLAISSWRSTDSSLPPHKRLAMSLRESGTAITVTSLTDVVLFGLCAISSTPAITVFSIFTAVAMAFDYIYQLTFFTAVLAYSGRREAKKVKSCLALSWPSRKPKDHITNENCMSELDLQFVQKKLASLSQESNQSISKFMKTKYAPFLTQPLTKMVIFILYIFYIAFAFYGCTKLRININNGKAYLDNSPLQPFFSYIEPKYLWENVQAKILVRRPPDFRNETERDLFEKFLTDVESTPYSRGPVSTLVFFRDYQKHLQFIQNDPDDFYRILKEFLEIVVHSFYKSTMHWSTTNGTYKDDPNATVTEFYFVTGFTAGERGWEGRLSLLHEWRNLSRRYSRYDVVLYDFGNLFVDQFDTMDDETNQQVGIGVLGMLFMAAVFIPSISSIFWVAWTLLSMDFGIIAILACWGCDLDPMVMCNIVMSLDFAVEYAAHVCHRYYVSKEAVDNEKVADTLGAVGWPVLQGGIAAILAVIPLAFVRSYVVKVFLKTILSVVAIGLIHALVLLPIFVSTVSLKKPYVPVKSVVKLRKNTTNNDDHFINKIIKLFSR